MPLSKHALKRLHERAALRGLDVTACMQRLSQAGIHNANVAVVLGTAKGQLPGVQYHLVAICRDGNVVTVEWEQNPSPSRLRVERVI